MAEDHRVSLPIIVGYDGWDVSHSTSRCSVPSQDLVDAFLPPYTLPEGTDRLAPDWYEVYSNRRNFEWSPEWYMENRYKAAMALETAKVLFEEVGSEFREKFGSNNVGLVEADHCRGTDVVLLTMGAMTSTARLVAKIYRQEGLSVGVLKLRSFRPFPTEALRQALAGAKMVVAIDRDMSAAVYDEVRMSLFGIENPPRVMGRVAGLGGREISYYVLAEMVDEAFQALKGENVKQFDWKLWLE